MQINDDEGKIKNKMSKHVFMCQKTTGLKKNALKSAS